MTVNHDVVGSSPTRGAKTETESKWTPFLFCFSFWYEQAISRIAVMRSRTELSEVGSWQRENSLNGCFLLSKAQSKECRKRMSERPRRLCACRVARRLFAPTREFDVTMMSLVQVGQGEP